MHTQEDKHGVGYEQKLWVLYSVGLFIYQEKDNWKWIQQILKQQN